jgi:capsule polysaccharide export protein KpsE/RkpR
MENNKNITVNYRKVLTEILKRKRLFYYILPITFILSSLYIICIPRTYSTDTEVAPEIETPGSGSSAIGSLASTFGLDLSTMQSSDAITPLLYPDLMDDNGFVMGLFSVKVKSQDGRICTNYYTYLNKYQKAPWWAALISWISQKIKSKDKTNRAKDIDPYNLSKNDYDIVKHIRSDIKIEIDKKTGAITISTKAQDPLICKTIADSAREHLQQFIIRYRTNKARKDLEYYKKLTTEAKQDYDRQRQLYGSYADANTDLLLESFKSKQEDLENEMQLKYNAYSTLNTQLQAARAKVQERTPAFMLIKGAPVPIKPAEPKRMLFVLSMVILAFIGTCIYILRDIILPKESI